MLSLRAALPRTCNVLPAPFLWRCRRWKHCIGCASETARVSRMQSASPIEPNWSAEAAITSKAGELIAGMSAAQRHALQWNNGPNVAAQHTIKRPKEDIYERTSNQKDGLRKLETRSLVLCQPCVTSRAASTTDVTPTHQGVIPGKTFHVIDAVDFPIGLSLDDGTAAGEDQYVISRCDLICSTRNELPKFKDYVMKTVFEPLGINASRVHTVSGLHGWNLSKMAESLASGSTPNCFVGQPNSGKTRLVHALAGVRDAKGGLTTWPVPFTTLYPSEFRSLPEFRRKKIVDMPSDSVNAPLALYQLLSPAVLRKASKGISMTKKWGRFSATGLKAKTGSTVSVGGLIGLELPPVSGSKQIPVHAFPLIGGYENSQWGQVFRSAEKINEINRSVDANHRNWRMHSIPNLPVVPIAEFEPVKNGERQSLVIKGLGSIELLIYAKPGELPPDYAIIVHAPEGIEVATRPQILPYLS